MANELVSIVILSCNTAKFAERCILSIRDLTSYPNYRIILIDNGSNAENLKILQGLKVDKFIRLEENIGFPKGCNLGIRSSRGKYICLLNDDTIVSKNWLTQLVEASKKSYASLVGPMSNYVANEKQDIKNFDNKLPKTYFDVDSLIFFCVLIRRDLIEKIGLLDEIYGMGSYEDNDYCMKAKKIGAKIIVDGFTFIFHHGSQANLQIPEWRKVYDTNEKIFNERWKDEIKKIKT